MLAPAQNFARGAASGLLNLLMPPLCIACKAPTGTALSHCAECWAALPVIEGARCDRCALPLPDKWQAETLCFGCLHEPPAFVRSRAPYLYSGPARQAVLALKGGREAYARQMGLAMLRAAQDMIQPGMLVVPVPLHRWRLLSRGFNQAGALAAAVAKASGAALLPDTLRRLRPTPRTKGMSRAQRRRNVRGAFHVPPAGRARLTGAHVLLVDDVMTSGATASACARILRRAGAASVSVLVYARVAAAGNTPYLGGSEGLHNAQD